MGVNRLHIATPCIESREFSRFIGSQHVWLKLENLQRSGSFKIRGIGLLCSESLRLQHCTEIICSSGGNAGLAAAAAASALGLPVQVYVPETTPAYMRARLRSEGATVHVHGKVWDETNRKALEVVERSSGALYVHPFDHPLIWTGHSTLVDELDQRPAAIVLSVGGGGLLLGVVQGLQRRGWTDVPVVAAETVGAASFAATFNANGVLQRIPTIDTVAKSLGALQVSEACAELIRSRAHPLYSYVCTDQEAVEAMLAFATLHRMLVEPACGAALTLVTSPRGRAFLHEHIGQTGNIVVVVCGGNMITPSMLMELAKVTGASGDSWSAM
ncbi:similar to serine dehydratase [Cyanidioschyzon merolae strain 10D]|uniref:L-serine ammonia-lyase n=1 Tax=Cyanidioschyzon merolae (strain NIES-3377 / 10D) TaxID=280699 RepID=M1VBE9_CYAM1|nr:similar to serine dehydratase [Cyanidioschyzon merolae strain 10D]BAM82624.1 similar to serine dehydratase [Cyanidioschyzon merolae strain 10D]|eukprot:XP_005538660.1 similar to serine dehydratase [Cyanidioschyzon merolae strain 10D]